MSRLSRENQRECRRDADSAAPRTPIDVRVPVPVGDGGAGGTTLGASVGGVPVVPADGQEIQQAVLTHLHLMAVASGRPVLATIHDDRMGYVIPLRVDLDGSSHLTGDPAPVRPGHVQGVPPVAAADRHTRVPRPVEEPVREPAPASPAPASPVRAAPERRAEEETGPGAGPAEGHRQSAVAAPSAVSPTEPESESPRSHQDSSPTFRLRPVPRWVADQQADAAGHGRDGYAAGGTPPGTVAAPTGAFGPPPRMDPVPGPTRWPDPVPDPTRWPDSAPDPTRWPDPARVPERAREDQRGPEDQRDQEPPAPTRPAAGPPVLRHDPTPDLVLAARLDPHPEPTPPRGFDAVAEAVLGDEPVTAPGDDTKPALLAGPMGRINDAVRGGRTEEAARLAGEAVAEASRTLGAEHPEVLRLQELTAYIAYLAGEPYRALRLSLDLAGVHRRRGDAEAAYGNVQSAATAWRAVRDPARGLELGRELIGLWTDLATEGGPAAEEIEQLDSVHARMNRLADRAARAAAGTGPE